MCKLYIRNPVSTVRFSFRIRLKRTKMSVFWYILFNFLIELCHHIRLYCPNKSLLIIVILGLQATNVNVHVYAFLLFLRDTKGGLELIPRHLDVNVIKISDITEVIKYFKWYHFFEGQMLNGKLRYSVNLILSFLGVSTSPVFSGVVHGARYDSVYITWAPFQYKYHIFMHSNIIGRASLIFIMGTPIMLRRLPYI